MPATPSSLRVAQAACGFAMPHKGLAGDEDSHAPSQFPQLAEERHQHRVTRELECGQIPETVYIKPLWYLVDRLAMVAGG